MVDEGKAAWWVAGVQARVALGSGRADAFLAAHAVQATDACLGFLRTVPPDAEADLAPLVARLGGQILAHTRLLCIQAELSPAQSERLMAASSRGFGRFEEAFRCEVRAGRGLPGADLLPGIEAALAGGTPLGHGAL